MHHVKAPFAARRGERTGLPFLRSRGSGCAEAVLHVVQPGALAARKAEVGAVGQGAACVGVVVLRQLPRESGSPSTKALISSRTRR